MFAICIWLGIKLSGALCIIHHTRYLQRVQRRQFVCRHCSVECAVCTEQNRFDLVYISLKLPPRPTAVYYSLEI